MNKGLNSNGKLIIPLSKSYDEICKAGVKCTSGGASSHVVISKSDEVMDIAEFAGADATAETPEIINWLCSAAIKALGGPLHIYSGIYLDGEGFVRASVAMDAIVDGCTANAEKCGGAKPVLLYIDTPSHAHLVPRSASAASKRYRAASGVVRGFLTTLGLLKPLKFRRTSDNAEREVMVGLASQQGPNYAVAKLLQRWRALVARDFGSLVSITNGPAAKTNSVMHSKTMAFVMNHIHWVAPNVAHEPETVKELMALIMVRDLHSNHALGRPGAKMHHALDICEENAWHGGMWLSPYDAQSTGVWIYLRYYGVRFGLPLLVLLLVTMYMQR